MCRFLKSISLARQRQRTHHDSAILPASKFATRKSRKLASERQRTCRKPVRWHVLANRIV